MGTASASLPAPGHPVWSVRPSRPLALWQFGLVVVSVLALMLAMGSLIPGGSDW